MLLENIPKLTPSNREEAARFRTLIDALYEAAISAGALGGKLCGAGGGGFLLMVVPPERAEAFKERMRNSHLIKIEMDSAGSTILAG